MKRVDVFERVETELEGGAEKPSDGSKAEAEVEDCEGQWTGGQGGGGGDTAVAPSEDIVI